MWVVGSRRSRGPSGLASGAMPFSTQVEVEPIISFQPIEICESKKALCHYIHEIRLHKIAVPDTQVLTAGLKLGNCVAKGQVVRN